jgi:hypothetical protein
LVEVNNLVGVATRGKIRKGCSKGGKSQDPVPGTHVDVAVSNPVASSSSPIESKGAEGRDARPVSWLVEFEDLRMPASLNLTRYCTLSHRKYEKGSHRAAEGHSPLFTVDKTLSLSDASLFDMFGNESGAD